MISTTIRLLLTILDSRCPPCGTPHFSFSLCSSCSQFPVFENHFCLSCEAYLSIKSSCTCVFEPREIPRAVVFSSFEFNSIARNLLHSIKYRGKYRYLSLLKSLLPKQFPFNLNASPTLVPIPLSLERFGERTFNQSEWLARELSKTLGFPFDGKGLVKTRDTLPQSSLGREERKTNLENVFDWITDRPAPQSVCLVDDVYTTGETLRAGARALAKAGTKEIFAWTLFRKLF